MMNLTIQMPMVETCSVSECAYNKDTRCHAKAITIGDGIHPDCDTYCDGTAGQTHATVTAGVGACKVAGCSHNVDLECMADSIAVSFSGGEAHCMTFTQS